MKTGQFGIDDQPVFVIDQSRCIGCEACVQACAECGTHRGQSLIHLERVDRATSTQTAPMVCMHCEDPTCAQVCPADAIKQTEDGIVQSALKPRCIGCQACVNACAECDTHRGVSMIHVDFLDRARSIATVPTVCMHCDDPTCAQVCPADAIKKYEDGVVGSSLKPRCIACSNCVLACPFGVPKYVAELDQMMKCDMCTDRTSEGLTPMCASVCPSEALWYGTIEQFNDTRRGSLLRDFMFGRQEVRTKVYTVIDDALGGPLDVLAGVATTWLDDPFGLDETEVTR